MNLRSCVSVSELQEVLGLITSVMQHMVKLEHDLYAHLEAQIGGISELVDSRIGSITVAVDSRLNDLDWRLRDLGTCFANALDMESKLRSQDIADIRTELKASVKVAAAQVSEEELSSSLA